MSRRTNSPLFTAWLVFLIIWNAASALQWSGIALLLLFTEQAISNVAPEDLDDFDDADETATMIRGFLPWCLLYVLARCTCIFSVAWLFQWRKWAFWSLCFAVLTVYALNLWG